MNELQDLLREEGKVVWLYVGKETINDPDYADTTVVLSNPIPVKALVTSMSPERVIWKFQGIKISEAIEIIIQKNYLSTVRKTQKIIYDGNEYYGYRENFDGFSLQILDDNYIKVSTVRIK